MKEHYDFLIVGAGLFGCTFARLATDAGFSCLIVDKRDTIGGNLYCEEINGIQVHKYGPHIFHTNNDDVWEFVNRFCKFNRYTNTPIAKFHGELYNMPFNMNTFYRLFGVTNPKDARNIIEAEVADAKRNIGHDATNLEEQALMMVGKTIYEHLIKEYTEKQWGRPCNELPADIIKRLPVRLTFDNNYFNAKHQGIPEGGGYNDFISNMVEGVDVLTSVNYLDDDLLKGIADKIIYTGQIDEFFGYKYGKLEYRTVEWKNEIMNNCGNYQGVAVMNYTGKEVPFTRCIEHKFFNYPVDFENKNTVISNEYSREWHDGSEPFYPIQDEKNCLLYQKYKEEADKLDDVYFGGRLGEYKYYDMDKTIESAMELFSKLNK